MVVPSWWRWLVGLAGFAAAVAFVAWRQHVVQAHVPRLDRSTPADQNGFTFLAVSTVPADGGMILRTSNRDGTGALTVTHQAEETDKGSLVLWLYAPSVPATTGGQSAQTDHRYHAMVRAPTGEEVQAKCVRVFDSGSGRALLYAIAPSRWPDTFRYLDFIVAAGGAQARWRVTNLPESVHAIPNGTKPAPVAEVHGLRLSGRAVVWSHAATPGMNGEIAADVAMSGAPLGAGPWEIEADDLETEWEPTTGERVWGPRAQEVTANMTHLPVIPTAPIGYRGARHLVRLRGKLRRFEAIDEPVTFRDLRVEGESRSLRVRLDTPQTAVAPSGLRVTLPAQPRGGMTSIGDLAMWMELPDKVSASDLPNSPIARKHGGEMGVSLIKALPPFQLCGWSDDGRHRTIGVRPIQSAGQTIPSITFVVRHRATVAEYPFELVMPVEEGAPAKRR